MSAEEIVTWKQYFDLFPFSVERQERGFAMLASVITNVSGKMYKNPIPEIYFMPDYLGERQAVVTTKSIEQQTQEALKFRERLAEVKKP